MLVRVPFRVRGFKSLWAVRLWGLLLSETDELSLSPSLPHTHAAGPVALCFVSTARSVGDNRVGFKECCMH